jgi:hypothetical protein
VSVARLRRGRDLTVYCDESGGIGRGVMTLAALSIAPEDAAQVLHDVRELTGLGGELKGSRIDMATRAFIYDRLDRHDWHASVTVAISATRPEPGSDRGDHDMHVYAALIEAALVPLIPSGGDCIEVIIDDGRYSVQTLSAIRADIAAMIGPCGLATLVESHRLPGLQIADVIANTFFNRALPTDRQGALGAIVQPRLDAGRIRMQVLPPLDAA